MDHELLQFIKMLEVASLKKIVILWQCAVPKTKAVAVTLHSMA